MRMMFLLLCVCVFSLSHSWLSLELMRFCRLVRLISPSTVTGHWIWIIFLFLSFFLIQRWNNGGKRRPLAELCPLQTNLPAPSFCPSQIGAGREGQTLNPEAGLGGVICRADQIPRGCLREGSLLTDQLVTDVPDSWKGALPPSPPKHTPPPTAPLVQLLHSNLPGERQQWVGPLTPADWALTQVPKVQPRQTRDAKPKSCCWQWYSNLIWVIAVVGNGSRSSPLCDLGGGMLWSDQGVEMGKIWARQ